MDSGAVADKMETSDSGVSGVLKYPSSEGGGSPRLTLVSPLLVERDQELSSSSSSGSDPPSSSSSTDDLYFIPKNKEMPVLSPATSGDDVVVLEKEVKPVKSSVCVVEKRQPSSRDAEIITPTKMPKLSPVPSGPCKIGGLDQSFKSRRTKAFVLNKRSRRQSCVRANIQLRHGPNCQYQVSRNSADMENIMDRMVQKTINSMQTMFQTMTENLRQQLIDGVKQEFESFKTVFERSIQPSPKSRRGRPRVACMMSQENSASFDKKDEDEDGQGQSIAAVENVDGGLSSSQKSEEQVGDKTSSGSTVPPSSSQLNADSNDKDAILETYRQACQGTPAFNELLKHVTSISLLEKLQARLSDENKQDLTQNIELTENSASDDVSSVSNSQNDDSACSPSISSVFSLSSVRSIQIEEQCSYLDSSSQVSETQANVFVKTEEDSTHSQSQSEEATWITTTTGTSEKASPVATNVVIGTPKNMSFDLVPKPEHPGRRYREPLKCDFCGKHFNNNSSLKQHTSFHRPTRPYVCEHSGCDKAYKTRSELNRHAVVHSGQKNYECKKCSKKFLRKQYLKTHLLRHDEPLTWQCDLCPRVFVTENDLSKHKISYHKNGKHGMDQSKQTEPLELSQKPTIDAVAA